MKPQVLEQARSTVEAFLRRQAADMAVDVLSVTPERLCRRGAHGTEKYRRPQHRQRGFA